MFAFPPTHKDVAVPIPSIILTEHAFVRPLITQDFPVFRTLFQTEYMQRCFGVGHLSSESLTSVFVEVLASYKTGAPCFIVAIADKAKFNCIGILCLAPTRMLLDTEVTESRVSNAEIALAVLDEYIETPYGIEGLFALVRYSLQSGVTGLFYRVTKSPALKSFLEEAGFAEVQEVSTDNDDVYYAISRIG